MGVAVYGAYYGLYLVTKSNLWAILLSILAGVLLYFILLLVFRCLNEEDFYSIPMGRKLLAIIKLFHLM